MNLASRFIVLLILINLSACASYGQNKVKKEAKSKQASMLNVQLASGYIKRRKYEVAKEKLEKAIEQDDENVVAYTTMAVLMDLVDEPEKAEDYFLEAISLDGKNPELLNNYGSFLCQHDKITQAIVQFNIVIKNQFYETPEKPLANLGYCLLKAKNPDYKLAEKNLRAALKIQPRLPSALLAMAELGVETKRFLLTRAYVQRLHAVRRPTSASLWLAIQSERALGDRKHFLELSRKLLKYFSDSPEAKKVLELSDK